MQDTFPTAENVQETVEVIGAQYEGAQLDVQSQLDRKEAWRQTGECPGPTAIGEIEVSPGALELLEREMQFGYTTIEKRLKDGETRPTYIGARLIGRVIEEVELSKQASALLQQIEDSFNQIVRTDMLTSNGPGKLSQGETYITAGMYSEQNPDLHIDYETGPFRYIATLAGPTTEFVQDTVADTSVFDTESGALIKDAQVDNIRVPVKVNEVNRFLGDADPHALPVTPVPVFRIFVNGYVYCE